MCLEIASIGIIASSIVVNSKLSKNCKKRFCAGFDRRLQFRHWQEKETTKHPALAHTNWHSDQTGTVALTVPAAAINFNSKQATQLKLYGNDCALK